jgi:hypothetical protein
MKKQFLLFFIVFASFFKAQNAIDFDLIKKEVTEKNGKYEYEKLLFKFVHLPSSLDSLEANRLYYGKIFYPANKDKVVVIGDLMRLSREKKYTEAIEEGERLMKEDPVSLEILGSLFLAYKNGNPENKNFDLRTEQFRILVNAVVGSRENTEKGELYTVTSVADEYIVGNILGHNLYVMRRSSDRVAKGYIDRFKLLKTKISFLVVYLKE